MKTSIIFMCIYILLSGDLVSSTINNSKTESPGKNNQSSTSQGNHYLNKSIGQNTGSAYFKGNSCIQVRDVDPVNPAANPSAYVITGKNITVEAWVFPMSVPEQGENYILVSRPYWGVEPWHAYELRIERISQNLPKLSFIISDGNVPHNLGMVLDTGVVQVGAWTHVAGTYDGSYVRLYINGGLVAETPYSANIGSGNTGLYIGGLGWQYYHGLIDEVRLWNITRSQAEIQSYKDSTLMGNEIGLIGYWPLDEATTVDGKYPVTIDKTSNHNDLWVQYGAWFVDMTPGEEVKIAPEFIPTSLYGAVGKNFKFRPTIFGWPQPVFYLISGPLGMVFHPDSQSVSWIPETNQDGYHYINFKAINPGGQVQGTYKVWIDEFSIERMDHNNNEVILSISNNGDIGRWDASTGFTFNGKNGLFLGSPIIAQSKDQVSGSIFVKEFGTRSMPRKITSYINGFDRAFEVKFDDQRAPNPIGVAIMQRSHSKSTNPDRNFVILDYEIINTSGDDLSNIYIGLAMDFDIGDPYNNRGGFDSLRSLSYMYEVGGVRNPYYYGMLPLTEKAAGHTIWISGGNENSDSTLYSRMTTFNPIPTDSGDKRVILSTGPYTIKSGKSERVLFAVLAGLDSNDLMKNADAARALKYYPFPKILSIKDVPNDQGGVATLKWGASSLDNIVNNLSYYSIWRAIPSVNDLQQRYFDPMSTITIDFKGTAYRQKTINNETYSWEWLANQPAHRFTEYSFTAPTLFDSMSSTDGKHYFLVSAHSDDPNVFYDSNIASGYSVDNLSPLSPNNLTASKINGQVFLHWNANTEIDLHSYVIYRGNSPDTLEFLTSTSDTSIIDENPISGEVYYALRARDVHENMSPMSEVVSIIVTNIDKEISPMPTLFKLEQNYPNPFNPTTEIKYQMPEAGWVSLRVYSTLGQEVATLVDEMQDAGYKLVEFKASDLPSGLYFYRLSAGTYTSVKKMIVLR
ncbi:MAG: T9SS type A sorting domain-containing protein [Bacteroidota bacterium]|nr:T9SS type A sorting domain-containing protein [Bacteroidota bacterium]